MNKITLLLALIPLTGPLPAQQSPQDTPPSMSDIFMQQLDTDKDGKVTKAEFLKPQEAQFAHIDTNQDGSIDKGEAEAFATKRQRQIQQLRQQQQQQVK